MLNLLINIANAQSTGGGETIQGIVGKFQNQVLIPLISLLFVLATVIFLWGIIQYVIGSRGDDNKLKKGKDVIKWGIIGMTIMASAWGIVRMICNYFGTCAAGSYNVRGTTDNRVDGTLRIDTSPTTGQQSGSKLPPGVSPDILNDPNFQRTTTQSPPPPDNQRPPTGKGSWLFTE